MDDENIKRSVKQILRIDKDYTILEIVEALILNDSPKINEISERARQLKSAYEHFEEEFESGNEERRHIALSSMKRPER